MDEQPSPRQQHSRSTAVPAVGRSERHQAAAWQGRAERFIGMQATMTADMSTRACARPIKEGKFALVWCRHDATAESQRHISMRVRLNTLMRPVHARAAAGDCSVHWFICRLAACVCREKLI